MYGITLFPSLGGLPPIDHREAPARPETLTMTCTTFVLQIQQASDNCRYSQHEGNKDGIVFLERNLGRYILRYSLT